MLAAFFLHAWPGYSAEEREVYAWPIRAPKYISATFGEPRPGRFHLGLDFKSGGAIGKEVYALDDGHVVQIRTSPFGYGKALYVKLNNGKTAVYGHLSGFMPSIEDTLFHMRIEKGSYDINWYPPAGLYPVRKGEVIAYSGDTGSGPAHLHLEIRDANNVPENPLNYGFEVRDTIPPTIQTAALIPLDVSSSVNGLPVTAWVEKPGAAAEPFVLSGRIGVAADVFDRANDANNRLGPYLVTLAVDSTVVFTKTYDRISYDEDRFGAFDNMPGALHGGGGYVSALYRQTGNTIGMYRGDGVLTEKSLTGHEPHTLTIRAVDRAGNESSFSFRVVFAGKPFFTVCECTQPGRIHVAGRHHAGTVSSVEIDRRTANGGWERFRSIAVNESLFDVKEDLGAENTVYRIVLVADDGAVSRPAIIRSFGAAGASGPTLDLRTYLYNDRIVIRAQSADISSSIPVVRIVRNGEEGALISLTPENDRSWVSAVPCGGPGRHRVAVTASIIGAGGGMTEKTAELDFIVVDSASGATVFSQDSLFTLTVPPGALYRSSTLEVNQGKARSSNGLKPMSEAYCVNWGDYPIKGSSGVRLRVSGDIPSTAALYVSGNGSNWRFLSAERDGDVFTGNLGGQGHITVMIDDTPPYLAAASPSPGRAVRDTRPLIVARLEDRGSGIAGSDAIRMTLDGIRIYGEYDYEANRVSYRPHNPLKTGKHTVDVTVRDRVGNEKSVSWDFTVNP